MKPRQAQVKTRYGLAAGTDEAEAAMPSRVRVKLVTAIALGAGSVQLPATLK